GVREQRPSRGQAPLPRIAVTAANAARAIPHLRWRIRRVVLEHLDIRNDVTLATQMGGQPLAEEILRSPAAAPTEAAGIVLDDDELSIHGELSKGRERCLTKCKSVAARASPPDSPPPRVGPAPGGHATRPHQRLGGAGETGRSIDQLPPPKT